MTSAYLFASLYSLVRADLVSEEAIQSQVTLCLCSLTSGYSFKESFDESRLLIDHELVSIKLVMVCMHSVNVNVS